MRELAAYLHYVKLSFLEQIAFRINTVMTVLAYPVIVVANFYLFGALFDHADRIAGYGFREIFTYISVVWFARTVYAARIDRIIGARIRSGDVALDLLRPLRFPLIYFAVSTGKALHRIVFITLPVALICIALKPVDPPAGWGSLLFFLWSVLCGFVYTYVIAYGIGIACFHLGYNPDLTWTFDLLIGLLAGLVVPLRFFPGWLEKILLLLPFQHLYFTPAQIYIGEVSPGEFGSVFLSQVIGFLVLLACVKVVELTGFRRLVIQGG